MPGFDRTGPTGAGPKTGRGAGPCDSNEGQTPRSTPPRFGFGRGAGAGGGRGGGRGWRFWRRNSPQ